MVIGLFEKKAHPKKNVGTRKVQKIMISRKSRTFEKIGVPNIPRKT